MKPTIKKIEFTSEELEEIDKIKKGQAVPKVRTLTSKNGSEYDVTYNKRFSFHLGRKRLLELYGGICILCGKYPDYKVSHDVGDKNQGAKLIQRYCQKCFSKQEERIKK
jgi:hypothetical protein